MGKKGKKLLSRVPKRMAGHLALSSDTGLKTKKRQQLAADLEFNSEMWKFL